MNLSILWTGFNKKQLGVKIRSGAGFPVAWSEQNMDLVLVSTNPVLAMFKHYCQNLEKVLLNACYLHSSSALSSNENNNSQFSACLLLFVVEEDSRGVEPNYI